MVAGSMSRVLFFDWLREIWWEVPGPDCESAKHSTVQVVRDYVACTHLAAAIKSKSTLEGLGFSCLRSCPSWHTLTHRVLWSPDQSKICRVVLSLQSVNFLLYMDKHRRKLTYVWMQNSRNMDAKLRFTLLLCSTERLQQVNQRKEKLLMGGAGSPWTLWKVSTASPVDKAPQVSTQRQAAKCTPHTAP